MLRLFKRYSSSASVPEPGPVMPIFFPRRASMRSLRRLLRVSFVAASIWFDAITST